MAINKKYGLSAHADATQKHSSQTSGINAHISEYFGNIAKEAGDFKRAYKRTDDARGKIGAGTDAEANRLRKQQDRAGVQFLASFVGNKYDKKGRRTK